MVVALLMPLCSPANPLVYGNVSGWTVWTDPALQYSCFAEANYEGGSSIRAGFESGSFLVHFNDDSWAGIVPGTSYELTLEFDDETVQSFTGTGLPLGGGVRFTVPNELRASFVNAFVRAYWVSVTPGQLDSVLLSLGGSRAALRMLEECEASMARFN